MRLNTLWEWDKRERCQTYTWCCLQMIQLHDDNNNAYRFFFFFFWLACRFLESWLWSSFTVGLLNINNNLHLMNTERYISRYIVSKVHTFYLRVPKILYLFLKYSYLNIYYSKILYENPYNYIKMQFEILKNYLQLYVTAKSFYKIVL